MRESVGKARTRELFFREYLPHWLSPEELKTGNFLVLLGENSKELAYFDEYEVSRQQVFSVERDSEIYRSQLTQDLKTHLWEGELLSYLPSLLRGNENFLVFNLDVEGSYLSQLDQAMTPVLLFSWRNSRTVIATYSSVGRDTEMIWEGIKSLAIFLWIDRQKTLEVLAALTYRYEEAGFDSPVFMALRDLFWIRSMMEHSLVASVSTGVTSYEIVKRWFRKTDIIWSQVRLWRRSPLRVQNVLDIIDLFSKDQTQKMRMLYQPPSCIGTTINHFKHVVYNAERPWSQLCYFATFSVLPHLISCREWLAHSFDLFLTESVTYIDREGVVHDFSGHDRQKNTCEFELWRGYGVYDKFRPRKLHPFYFDPHTTDIVRMKFGTNAINGIPHKGEKREMKTFVSKKGVLTEDGKELIRQFAREWPDTSTEELLKLLPKPFAKVEHRSLVANVAVARRKKS